MIIYTSSCKIRSFESSDVEEFYSLVHEDIIEKYVRYMYCKNLAHAQEFVNDYIQGDCKNEFYLVIEKEGNIVGCIIALKIKESILDVAVCLGKNFRGQGIMKEAMEGFITWLKENTEYYRLDIAINKNNTSSLKLIDKIGAELYRFERDNYFYHILHFIFSHYINKYNIFIAEDGIFSAEFASGKLHKE